ncbi:MAG: segregation/condensation protein A [Peptococcaceae bacterium]|nr:segregation/condensation protein A [Peptococcaceae bacterium]
MTEENKYQVHLNNFDGPLDLLLHLIEKNKVDIYDIPIASITEQYLEYLAEARQMDLEIASEFLLLAATLINIKAKMLLPKKIMDNGEEEVDPRQELVQRLLEYKFYKEAAVVLQQRENKEPEYMLKPVDIEQLMQDLKPENPVENIGLAGLYRAFCQVMEAAEPEEKESMILVREEYYVEDSMEQIKERLEKEKSIEFSTLFPPKAPRRQIVTIFLALLELCRLDYLNFQQEGLFTPLWIFPKTEAKEVN